MDYKVHSNIFRDSIFNLLVFVVVIFMKQWKSISNRRLLGKKRSCMTKKKKKKEQENPCIMKNLYHALLNNKLISHLIKRPNRATPL